MKIPFFLKTYFSPFKSLKLSWYFGKTAIGVPVFLPRKWIRLTEDEIRREAFDDSINIKKSHKSFEEWVEHYSGMKKAIPLKVGFSFAPMRWKMKYDSYRFETEPVWSFVFYGYQLAVTFTTEDPDQYWESFLAWYYETDKKLSWQERIKDCRKRFPQKWTTYIEGKIDYWDKILKNKYK